MTINSISTFLFNDVSRADLGRIQTQLVSLQNEVSSGHKAGDLSGYGSSAGTLLTARGLIAQKQAYVDSANSLDARFTATDQSLSAAYDAGESLRQSILSAIGNNDGSYVVAKLQASFDSARTALNVSYQDQALFGGERAGATPVNVTTLAQLSAAPSTASIFDESTRVQTADLGDGPFALGQNASAVSTGLFDAMRTLQQTIEADGGTLGKPLSASDVTALQGVATALSAAGATITTAQGLNGDLQKRVAAKASTLTDHINEINKTLTSVADADLAEVATKINAAQVQYQAVAQTYSQLSQMSLLKYLTTP